MQRGEIGGQSREPVSYLCRLQAAALVQRNVVLALKAPLGVPVGLAVTDEIEGPRQDDPSRSSEMSGASGFFMPTT